MDTYDFELTDEVMDKINRLTRRPLKKERVYAFPVILCDNEIDRDGERFSGQSIEKLATLFVGKTGIFDHDPKGRNQTARIFDTCVDRPEGKLTSDGEQYICLVARAYMVRNDRSAALIDEIDAGIKKEVSISCAVAKKTCSVCGKDIYKERCSHIKGREYGGKKCYVSLEEPTDAYEWSFVAVPAQVNAGVTKTFGKEAPEVQPSAQDKRLADEHLKMYKELKGRINALLALSGEARLYTADIIGRMTVDELISLEKTLARELTRPAKAQLTAAKTNYDKYKTDK